VRKAAPFPIDEAQVSYVAGARAPDGHEFIVSVARRAVVEEYEAICTAAGAHAGLVDISTFNVVNAILAGSAAPTADWLLVNVAADYTSIAIMRHAGLIFFRSRGSEGDGSLADLVHQTAMYYEDRLQGAGFARVMLSGASASLQQATDVDQIRRRLEERLGTTVETVDARTAATLTDRIAAAPALLDTLAPLVGLLLRDREAAA
jgi:Tfp pilus assembly PilM family ATPase